MPVSEAFIEARRDEIRLSTELAAYRAAIDAFDAGRAVDKLRLWFVAYGKEVSGVRYALSAAIRDRVLRAADGNAGITPLDIESAVRTLTAEFHGTPRAKPNAAAEKAAVDELYLRSR